MTTITGDPARNCGPAAPPAEELYPFSPPAVGLAAACGALAAELLDEEGPWESEIANPSPTNSRQARSAPDTCAGRRRRNRRTRGRAGAGPSVRERSVPGEPAAGSVVKSAARAADSAASAATIRDSMAPGRTGAGTVARNAATSDSRTSVPSSG